jgi:hypothetical protein
MADNTDEIRNIDKEADPTATGLGDAAGSVDREETGSVDGEETGTDKADRSVTIVGEEGDSRVNADGSVTTVESGTDNAHGLGATDDEEPTPDASVDESLKVCVQMVKDQTAYGLIAEGTTIAINNNGKYTVSKKNGENSPEFSPGNTYQKIDQEIDQEIVEKVGGKRRKSAKRGRKSSKGGRKSAKRGRKSVKRGRKGKGSRRSKK